MQPSRAQVVGPSFQHREGKLHRQDFLQHRQVLLRELLLQIDCMCRDDGLFAIRHGIENGRYQIRQALAHARSGLDGQVLVLFERPRNGDGHLLLLRTELEIVRFRQQACRRKNLLDSFYQIGPIAGRLAFNGTNHRRATTSCAALFFTSMFGPRTPRQLVFG